MTRIRKEPNRYWSKEEMIKIINEVLLNYKINLSTAIVDRLIPKLIHIWYNNNINY